MENIESLIAMLISEALIVFTFFFVLGNQKKKSQLKNAILILLSCFFVWTLGSILQILCQNTSIPPIFFEKIAGVGVHFSPVAFLALAIIFAKNKIELKWYHLLFLVIPIISTIVVWTNESHSLFFEHYSPIVADMVYGKYFAIHSIYTYLLFGIGLVYFFKYTFKNAGFFSKQSVLIIGGILVPLVLNLLGTLGIIRITTYITPISFSIMVLLYTYAIFKFNFTKITPIPLQRILDRISDGYIVVDENDIITDFNTTFLSMFNIKDSEIRSNNVYEWIHKHEDFPITDKSLNEYIEKTKNTDITVTFEKKLKGKQKYFHIEINSIRSKNKFLCTLILFKDITQHMLDMQTIRNNQDILMERERLASLGQLIGGIAHNLKTPIMSISGAVEGLEQLIDEYDSSIDDPLVNSQDHHDIAKDMRNWLPKIRTHIEYMSDIITTVKGQAVALSNQEEMSFTVEELVKRVNILMKHELKNSYTYLNVLMKTNEDLSLVGDVNSLVQVVNNMITNAIQAYNGKREQNIELEVDRKENDIVFSVRDFAGGLPKEVQSKLFKEMVTTKGKNGTGLGLYMSYSNIKARFGGDITFETEEGKGTTFNIIIPIRRTT